MGAGEPTATVVGGGIAGLAAALALAQAGWRVTVLERAPAFGEVGAGLATTVNGMTALAALGLRDAVQAVGYQTGTAGMQDSGGRWIARMPDTRTDPTASTTLWGLLRPRLHGVLRQAAAAADGVELVTGAEVIGVRPGVPGGAPAAVTWRAGGAEPSGVTGGASAAVTRRAGGTQPSQVTQPSEATEPSQVTQPSEITEPCEITGPSQVTEHTAETALLVAADGVGSAVRRQLFPTAAARYSGSTSWRAIITDAGTDGRLVQAWGPETEFGALRVSPDEIYWYGYFRHPEGAVFPDELAAARERFATWAPWVRDMVAATTADRLIRNDVYHLPGGLPGYTSGRVVFVGDAAHAMLPSAGQGAATALEDGVCVGRLIAAPVRDGADLASALAAFDQARRPRCQRIARTGITAARFGADLGGGWRQTVRNSALRLAPVSLLLKAGDPITRWTAPAP